MKTSQEIKEYSIAHTAAEIAQWLIDDTEVQLEREKSINPFSLVVPDILAEMGRMYNMTSAAKKQTAMIALNVKIKDLRVAIQRSPVSSHVNDMYQKILEEATLQMAQEILGVDLSQYSSGKPKAAGTP